MKVTTISNEIMRAALMLLLGLFGGLHAFSQEISENKAQKIAAQFMGSAERVSLPAEMRAKSRTQRGTTSQQPYYVFNSSNDDKFVVVSGDERMGDILGYSDSTPFNADSIPDGLQWVLNLYEEQAASLVDKPNRTAQVAQDDNDWPLIEPLLTTKWNQCTPEYNDFPYEAVAGCVATAIAQIVNYHKWPDVGEGYFSHDINGESLSIDYDKIPIFWDLLEDEYDENSSQESWTEIRKLMYACSVGCETHYEDGAGGSDIVLAKRFLVENFKYDADVRIVTADKYSVNGWKKLIYNELKAARPVYIQGNVDWASHAFVCDGYGGDRFFHFNWGWGGHMDGYFVFPHKTMNSDDVLEYQFGMKALVNIQKRTGEKEPLTADLFATEGYSLSSDSSYFMIGSVGSYYRYFGEEFPLYYEFENTETLESTYHKLSYPTHRNDFQYIPPFVSVGSYGYEFNFWDCDGILQPGNYRLYVCYPRGVSENKITRISISEGFRQYLNISVDSELKWTLSHSTEYEKSQAEVSLLSFEPLETFKDMKNYSLYLENLSDYPLPPINIDIFNQENKNVHHTSDVSASSPNTGTEWTYGEFIYLQPGKHEIIFTDTYGEVLNKEPYYINIEGDSVKSKATNLEVNFGGTDGYIYNYNIKAGTISNAESGKASPKTKAVISKNGKELSRFEINYTYSELWFNFSVDQPLIGEIQIELYDVYDVPFEGSPYTYYLEDKFSAIIDINALNNNKSKVKIYSITGMKLNAPQKGWNIIVFDNGTVRKVYVKE